MTTNHQDWHFLYVRFNDGSSDKIRSKSIITLANYVINNNELIKGYDMFNIIKCEKIEDYEELE